MNNAKGLWGVRLQAGCWVLLGWMGLVLGYAIPKLGWLAWFWPAGVMVLSTAKSARIAAYGALIYATTAYAFHLHFFWILFGPAAVLLWLILALWILFFSLGFRLLYTRLLRIPRSESTPVRFWRFFAATVGGALLWVGLEWVRSEGYPLKFSWLNVGYAWGQHPGGLNVLSRYGVYGLGFAAALFGGGVTLWRWAVSSEVSEAKSCSVCVTGKRVATWACLWALGMVGVAWVSPAVPVVTKHVQVAGIQLEFPTETEVLKALDRVADRIPETELFVLGEYTFTESLPDSMKDWCRRRQKYLVVGAQDPASDGSQSYFNSAFVINPRGEVVFKQAKSVPIQFFKDGIPAPTQEVWESPWGRLGICICYDLSYPHVVMGLVNRGAQALLVPTMDKEDWGKHQHDLHALVAPVRAAEFGVPIFRVASSGYSQLVDARGREVCRGEFPGQGTWI